MAQVDVKWPSEDEEFDAKTEGVEPTKVAVVDQSENEEPAAAEPESVVTPEENTAESADTAEESNDSDSEQGEPETAPEVPGETESSPEADKSSTNESEVAAEEPAQEETTEAPAAEEAASGSAPEEASPEPETPAEDPEPTPEPAPEASSKPVATFEPAAVNDTASEAEKPQVTATVSKGTGHMARNLIFVVLILIIAGLGAWSWMLYSDRNNLEQQVAELKKNPQDEVKRQSEAIISKLDAQINLPQGENPTIANVTDAAAAKKESEFFNDAKNGDKVIVYVNAGIAILYRPSTNKVILVAPLTIDKQKATSGTGTTQTQPTNTRSTNKANSLQ